MLLLPILGVVVGAAGFGCGWVLTEGHHSDGIHILGLALLPLGGFIFLFGLGALFLR